LNASAARNHSYPGVNNEDFSTKSEPLEKSEPQRLHDCSEMMNDTSFEISECDRCAASTRSQPKVHLSKKTVRCWQCA
jgi:hypothetical protein